MKKKVFRYKAIGISVVIFNSVMFLILGFATFDTYDLSRSPSGSVTAGELIISLFSGFLFILCAVTIVLVATKSRRSVLVLNLLYICLLLIISGAWMINGIEERKLSPADYCIFAGLTSALLLLLFLVNKFKVKEIYYESLDEIGAGNG